MDSHDHRRASLRRKPLGKPAKRAGVYVTWAHEGNWRSGFLPFSVYGLGHIYLSKNTLDK